MKLNRFTVFCNDFHVSHFVFPRICVSAISFDICLNCLHNWIEMLTNGSNINAWANELRWSQKKSCQKCNIQGHQCEQFQVPSVNCVCIKWNVHFKQCRPCGCVVVSNATVVNRIDKWKNVKNLIVHQKRYYNHSDVFMILLLGTPINFLDVVIFS